MSQDRRPRVVALTDVPFWKSAFGSHARLAALFGALTAELDLSVLSFAPSAVGAGSDRVRVVPHGSVAPLAAPSGRHSRRPFLRDRVRPDWLAAARGLLDAERPDAVIVAYLDRSWLLDAVPPETVTLLDSHDVMSQRSLSFARFGAAPSIAPTAMEEREIMAAYDAVIAISDADADDIRGRLGVPGVIVAPHAPPLPPPLPPSPPAPGPMRLLFVGSYAEANIAGLRWLLDQVWPALGGRFRLAVAGGVCGAIPAPPPGVTLLGRVDDLGAAMAAADVLVNPVFMGGGLKIKTLDAMAAGLPSVNSREAVRGLEAAVGGALLVADGRLEFIAHLLRLERDPGLRADLGAAARAFVERELSPARAFGELIAFLHRARRRVEAAP
ncbi:glycosyltransferase family 4 protein [Rubrimonas cliftonensis]|uniref:Glycosyltransferase involved in cell wall bisynthesis n=1 Tax=Rubrimonas cliftonensis TaxID=89524 RepID=A0A1H4CY60_9RHOB|nr:glycosyltransferase family 4 protein [Rubrimonas cliftonensis]SEA65238.1 Glycosyltransferase involved in cell wall bisynthesis [Rubrimonas cliftonensis]